MRKFTLAAVASLLMAGAVWAESRTWTSADGSKTFDGELVGVTGDQISVKRADGQIMTFALGIVSAADQEWVAANKDSVAEAAAAQVAANKMAAEISGNLAKGTISSGAEYYILYFAAST